MKKTGRKLLKVQTWRNLASQALLQEDAVRVLKILGAVEALTGLLDHAQDHLYEVTEKEVRGYLDRTLYELEGIVKEKRKKKGRKS